MCIKCKTKEAALDAAGLSLDLADALIDAFQLIERLKAKGATLDASEQQCYDRLSRFVRADDGEAQSAGPEQQGTEPDRTALVEALQKAFPGAQVIIGSPDELDAMIEKATSGRKPN